MPDKVIHGCAATGEVWVNNQKIDIERSRRLENKSNEFSWGYHGSGPSQLALAILLEICDNEQTAISRFQEFKRAFIAELPGDRDFSLPVVEIQNWLAQNKEVPSDAA